VKRHDVFVNGVQAVIEVVLFYHPACWWISKRIRVEREHCCDDIAVAACGDEVVYATAWPISNRTAAVPAGDVGGRRSLDGSCAPHPVDAGRWRARGPRRAATLLAAVTVVLVVGALTGRASSADGQALDADRGTLYSFRSRGPRRDVSSKRLRAPRAGCEGAGD
jgi:hypothetical protein